MGTQAHGTLLPNICLEPAGPPPLSSPALLVPPCSQRHTSDPSLNPSLSLRLCPVSGCLFPGFRLLVRKAPPQLQWGPWATQAAMLPSPFPPRLGRELTLGFLQRSPAHPGAYSFPGWRRGLKAMWEVLPGLCGEDRRFGAKLFLFNVRD